jgi:hypothetical protein
MMADEIAAGERAVTTAIREAGTGLKSAWREQIVGAGLGRRLANSIRAQVYPRTGRSLDAAALVWSKAPTIVGAHDAGPLIRSRHGFWLAIPTPAAGKALGGRRITPGGWERRTGLRLRFVYRRTGPSLLVANGVRLSARGLAAVSRSKTGRGQVSAPIFLLVPQVKLPKRLDLARDAERANAAVPRLMVAKWVGGADDDLPRLHHDPATECSGARVGKRDCRNRFDGALLEPRVVALATFRDLEDRCREFDFQQLTIEGRQ